MIITKPFQYYFDNQLTFVQKNKKSQQAYKVYFIQNQDKLRIFDCRTIVKPKESGQWTLTDVSKER